MLVRSLVSHRAHLFNGDGNGIDAHLGVMFLPANHALFEINLGIREVVLCSLHKILCILVGLKTYNIIPTHSAINILDHLLRQFLPNSGLGPGNMKEMLEKNGGMTLTKHTSNL